MSERREAVRRRVYLGGRIAHQCIRSDTACLVRNLSPGGARLVLSEAVMLPNDFDLVIDCHGTTQSVEIVWREGSDLGVRFVPVVRAHGEVTALRERFDADRGELTRLRSRMTEIEPQADPVGSVLH